MMTNDASNHRNHLNHVNGNPENISFPDSTNYTTNIHNNNNSNNYINSNNSINNNKDVTNNNNTNTSKEMAKRRFSISSTSTENILLEADLLLTSAKNSNSFYNDEPGLKNFNKIFKKYSNNSFKNVEKTGSMSAHVPPRIRTQSCTVPALCDVRVNDVIKFSQKLGRMSEGRVVFVGNLPNKKDVYLGLELKNEGCCVLSDNVACG
ncbi:hypothetical protein HELRODRAFT_169547 [Helobdella robusta]|uniref:CAP-Gly domain-containing protein n=1 Tax=Helobdella robusta TaxID=6412 RepID=T1F229_HELRO|nr:hypothetical protein HELRODRAFT_169547 [Helobdella robusta]ESO08659.1 hypothetical protein HELRODRAFT_169547 [Helobdella robusta]